jgi:hypothetical protein
VCERERGGGGGRERGEREREEKLKKEREKRYNNTISLPSHLTNSRHHNSSLLKQSHNTTKHVDYKNGQCFPKDSCHMH